MAYFDFHMHHFCKHFLTGIEKQNRVSLKKEVGVCVRLPEIEFILTSQSAPFQTQVPGSVLVSSIVPMERGFSKQKAFKSIIPKLTRLDKSFVQAIADGRITYWNLLNEELSYGLEAFEKQFPEYQFLHSMKTTPDSGRIGVVFSVEGGHAFMRESGSATDSLKEFRQMAKEKGITFLSCNITHLTRIDEADGQQELANFSYGMKMIADPAFYPRNKGITAQGLEFIKEAYRTLEGSPPVIIDIKHMSLLSRKELYRYRQDGILNASIPEGKHFQEVPIISSHTGVTGLSWDKFSDEVLSAEREEDVVGIRIARPIAGKNGRKAWFNPWSINLFDEEIEYIIRSGGMIGISLDQRILGFDPWLGKVRQGTKYLYGEEYLSRFEFDLLGVDVDELPERMAEFQTKAGEDLEEAKEVLGIGEQEFNKRLHTFYFCYNLLHIINVGFKWYKSEQELSDSEAMDKSWSHVCIGSDFDGLIDPINSFRNSLEWEDFEKKLNKHIVEACKSYTKERGGGRLPIEGMKGIPLYIRGLMYNNGKEFIERWLSN